LQNLPHTLVEVQNASYEVNNQVILNKVSFSINRGEIITIIGPNGAGKSTLIKLLAKLESPSSGQVNHFKKLTIGYVPQKLFLDKSMPIKVSRFMSLSGAPKTENKNALAQVKANHLWPKQVHNLSGGELQFTKLRHCNGFT